MRGAKKGHFVSQETREKLSKARKGKKFTKEWIEHLRLSHIGYCPSQETREKLSKIFFRHGENSINSPEYRCWSSIKTRCNNKRYFQYHFYGGRGITICDEWKNNFLQFLKDMGRRPGNNYSIDRINNNKGYSKENCRWTTISEQNRNKRNSVIFNSETATEASIRLGGSRHLVQMRMRDGWLIEKAFTHPLLS